MTVFAQIASWIADKIVKNLAHMHKSQARSFSADSHVVAMLYVHLPHSLSLNEICDSLHNQVGLFPRYGTTRRQAATVFPMRTRRAIWKHQFCRMFILVRAVLRNYFRLSSVVECCDTPRERRRYIIR